MSSEQERIAVYVRLSRHTDESSSIERQREACEALAVSRGGAYNRLTDLYVDDGASGWDITAARPGFDALQANLGRYTHVIVWKLDRLCRSLRTFVDVVDLFEKRGVALVSVKESIDMSTPVGKLIATILAVFAEMESENISLRRSDASRQFAHNGRWDRGTPPFGFRTVPRVGHGGTPEGLTLAVDEERAQWVRFMAAEILAGRSLKAVAFELNERGAPRLGGNAPWSGYAVRRVLTNPVMIGQAKYRAQPLVGPDGEPLITYPALLERWDFEAIAQRIAGNRFGGPPARRRDEMLLGGLVTCGRCGKRMVSASGRRRYWCDAGERYGPTVCVGHVANAARLEAFVEGAVSARLSADFLATAADWLRQEEELLNGADPRRRRRAEISTQLDRLEADRAAGIYDAPAAQARFHAQHKALIAELEDLDVASALGSMSPLFTFLDRLRGDGGFEAVWADPDLDRRALLGALIDRVIVQPPTKPGGPFHPDRVSIAWRGVTAPGPAEETAELVAA